MGMVQVRINQRDYQLACDDGQESQLIALAAQVDARARNLARQMPQASEAMLLLLTALTASDELTDAKREARNLRDELQRVDSMFDDDRVLSGQLRLMEMETAMADTLVDIAARIERLAEQLEA